MLGESVPVTPVESLELLSTNIDDMNPEWLPAVMDRLLAAGALDVWLTPILMKKGRPAHTLSVLADAHLSEALRGIVYAHTTSLGIRQLTRRSLPPGTTGGTGGDGLGAGSCEGGDPAGRLAPGCARIRGLPPAQRG